MANDAPGKPFEKGNAYAFKPGQSGNHGGRSKAYRELARYIREKTQDGKVLADHCLELLADTKLEPRVRLLALEWLGDRGIGKTVLAVDLNITDTPPPEAEIDWDAVPLDKRIRLLNAMKEIDELERKEPVDGDDGASS